MKLRTVLFTTALAAMTTAGAAFAVDAVVIDEITDEMVAAGYTKLHVRHGPSWVEVEGWGPEGKVERRYDGEGDMLRERLFAGEKVPVVDDGDAPIGERVQARTQARLGDGSCEGDCDGEPVQARTQTRTQTRAGDGSCEGDCDHEPVQARDQLRDGSGDSAGEGKQTRAGKAGN